MSRERELVTELAQLRWKKSQNERAVRSGLEATKTLKQKDTILSMTALQSLNKSVWINSVLKDELSRPLIISDEDNVNNKKADLLFQQRLLKYSHQQLDNIEKLAEVVVSSGNKSDTALQTKAEQLISLQNIKNKLRGKIKIIESKSPYKAYNLPT